MRPLSSCFAVILLLFSSCLASLQDVYTERLTLRPVKQNMLLAEFQFNSSQQLSEQGSHYTLFPSSLGQILEETNTTELHLRFGQGWWDVDFFGAVPRNGEYSGGIGVELWAWIDSEGVEDANANWKRLVNMLSGLFCASLNYIDEPHTSFPSGAVHHQKGLLTANTKLFRGALPSEPVCTENLTPFIKLLPCKSYAGLGSLLDGHRLFDTQWQSMAIDVFHPSENKISLVQTITQVLDVPRLLEKRRSPIPTPVPDDELVCDTSKSYSNNWVCLPVMSSKANWQMSDIFNKNISGYCPIAENGSEIRVLASNNWQTYLKPNKQELSFNETSNLGPFNGTTSFNLRDEYETDIVLSTDNTRQIKNLESSPIRVERSFTGKGQQEGGLRTVFTNSGTESIKISYFESLPWYMKVYLHTLKITTTNSSSAGQQDVLRNMYFDGAKDRKSPSQLELELEIPGQSSVVLSYEFDKSLLFIEEYPPDANHGFVIEPGLVVTSKGLSIRTTSLLLSLAVPDFSMVYNVIILSSTVMSFAYGNLYGTLTKSPVPEALAEKVKATSTVAQVLLSIRGLKRKFKRS